MEFQEGEDESQAMDTDNSGTITADELREAMKKQGSPLVQDELQGLLTSIDVDSTGSIDYAEFLAATVNLSQIEKEENMYKAFQFFDTDHSGYITRDELMEGLKNVGGTPDSIEAVLKEVDRDGDGKIDYDEFVHMMREGLSTKQSPAPTLRSAKSRRRAF